MAKLLTVHRKAYTRKTKSGATVQVKASTYTIRDKGAAGRGPKVVPPLEKGALGGPGFFSKSLDQQKKIVFSRARKVGEKKVVGELRALQVFFKRTDPAKSRRALELSKQVADSFQGTQRIN